MPTPIKQERIDLRATHEVKEELKRAAYLSGEKLSAFTLKAAQEKAKQILSEKESITLSDKERDKFFALLENPPESNTKLKKAMSKYLSNKKS